MGLLRTYFIYIIILKIIYCQEIIPPESSSEVIVPVRFITVNQLAQAQAQAQVQAQTIPKNQSCYICKDCLSPMHSKTGICKDGCAYSFLNEDGVFRVDRGCKEKIKLNSVCGFHPPMSCAVEECKDNLCNGQIFTEEEVDSKIVEQNGPFMCYACGDRGENGDQCMNFKNIPEMECPGDLKCATIYVFQYPNALVFRGCGSIAEAICEEYTGVPLTRCRIGYCNDTLCNNQQESRKRVLLANKSIQMATNIYLISFMVITAILKKI